MKSKNKFKSDAVDVSVLNESFEYLPDTGVILWKISPSLSVRKGEIAGCRNGLHSTIQFKGFRLMAHRVAFAIYHGKWPEKEIDHINGDPTDNRIDNLREASRAENARNYPKPKSNTSGLKGVTWNKASKKWQAAIRINGKSKYLGLFDCAEEAHKAYCEHAEKYHGQFARIA